MNELGILRQPSITISRLQNKPRCTFCILLPLLNRISMCARTKSEMKEISFVEAMMKGYQAYKESWSK